MRTISEQISELISHSQPQLLKIPPEIAELKPAPDKWSKKEILGHLIDSASNNHQRFVRAAQNAAQDFPPYNQNQWVEVQKYNDMGWFELIEFFSQYNFHICRILESYPEDALDNLCNIGKENLVTVKFIMVDYLRHLKHHIEQILGTVK